MSNKLACWQVCGGIFLISDCCEKAQPTVHGTTPRQMALDCRRQTEQGLGQEPVAAFLVSASAITWVPALILQWQVVTGRNKPNKNVFHRLYLVMLFFFYSNRNRAMTNSLLTCAEGSSSSIRPLRHCEVSHFSSLVIPVSCHSQTPTELSLRHTRHHKDFVTVIWQSDAHLLECWWPSLLLLGWINWPSLYFNF